MITADVIETVANSSRRSSPHGVSCHFVKIDNCWGVKVYTDEKERNYSRQRQEKAFFAGLAPSVGDSFDCGDRFCFVTEVAKTLVEEEDDDTFNECCREVDLANPTLAAEVEQLCDELKLLFNSEYSDNHYGNFGWLRGKLVCIDFGY